MTLAIVPYDLIGAGFDDENTLRVATLLIAALYVGPHIKPLVQATRLPHYFVADTSYWLRRGGIWRGKTMNYQWLDEFIDGSAEKALVGLSADALVGIGEVERRVVDGQVLYKFARKRRRLHSYNRKNWIAEMSAA